MMKTIFPIIVIWLVGVGVAQSKIPAKELPIALKLTPQVCFEPCFIRIELTIPQYDDNRWAIIEVDGPMLRTTSIQLNGASAAKRYTVEYKGLSAGDYKVVGALFNTTREVSRQTTTLIVKGS